MKCLIHAREADSLWVKEYFPDIVPCLLKVINKPLLEFYIDLCALLQIREIRLVTDFSTPEIERFLGDGARWGVNLSYNLVRPEDSLQRIMQKNSSFCRDEDLLIIDDFIFLDYDKNNMQSSISALASTPSFDQGGLKLLRCGDELANLKNTAHPPLAFRQLKSIVQYFELSLDILQNRKQCFVLPSYSQNQDAFLGINSEIPRGVYVQPPIFAGNNVRFRELTKIGPFAVFGDNVIVDTQTTVENSIIYDNTYIGSELELDHMIVYKNNLISGYTGDSILMTDDFLLAAVDQKIILSFFQKAAQLIFTIILIALLTIPYLLFSLFSFPAWRKYQKKQDFFLNNKLVTDSLPSYKEVPDGFFKRIFNLWGLDRYRLLFWVLQGKIFLVGNRMLDVQPRHQLLIREMPAYQPGIFSYVESIGQQNSGNEEMHEGFYLAYNNFGMDVRILFRCLWRRFLNVCE
jgi:hypothetical protein